MGEEARQAPQAAETNPRQSAAYQTMDEGANLPRDVAEVDGLRRRQGAPEPKGSPITTRIPGVNATSTTRDECRRLSIELENMPGALCMDRGPGTPGDGPQTSAAHSPSRARGAFGSFLRATDAVKRRQLLATRTPVRRVHHPTCRPLTCMQQSATGGQEDTGRTHLACSTLVNQSLLEVFQVACLVGMLLIALSQLMTATIPIGPHAYRHGTLPPPSSSRRG